MIQPTWSFPIHVMLPHLMVSWSLGACFFTNFRSASTETRLSGSMSLTKASTSFPFAFMSAMSLRKRARSIWGCRAPPLSDSVDLNGPLHERGQVFFGERGSFLDLHVPEPLACAF